MPPGRGIVCTSAAVALIAAVALVACKGGDSSSGGSASGSASGPTARPDPDPPPPPPPPPSTLAVAVPDQYRLPPAAAARPLPAAPAAYIFVPVTGVLRVGTTPALADAVEASDDHALTRLLPPRPPPGILDADAGVDPTDPRGAPGYGTIGTGRYGTIGGSGGGAGLGYGNRGGPSVSHLDVRRAAPDRARLVLVADQGTTGETVARVLALIGEPVAIAVDGGAGAAALDLLVGPFGSAYRGGDRLALAVAASGVVSLSTTAGDGQRTIAAAGAGLVDGAAVRIAVTEMLTNPRGGSLALDVDLPHDRSLAALVAALDAIAGRAEPVAIHVTGPGRLGGRAGPQVRIGQPSTVGDLDKNIIRRYIRRNINRIRYCYEKRLLVTPDLQGTVIAELVITAQGTVATATATGLDPEVASCVAGVLETIEFPKPKGGGIVKVTYPFTFSATGG